MRVGINTLSAHRVRTGIARYVTNLVRALLEIDKTNEYRLFVSHDNTAMFPEGRANCDKILGPAVIDNTHVRVVWEHLRLPTHIRKSRVDVFHAPTFVTPFLSRAPSVVTIADMTWFTHPAEHLAVKGRYFRALIPVAARRATTIIALSDSTRRDILRLLDVAPEKVVTVYCGVEAHFRPRREAAAARRLRERYRLPESFVLSVGMIEPRKNLGRLIRAFEEVRRRGFAGGLVLAGPHGWGYDAAVADVRACGLNDHVVFTGPVPDEDLPALLSSATVFAYPSLYEGFGLPVLEAMACGAPVVASAASSLPEVVGDAGLLVDPLDVGALAAALHHVLTEADLRGRLRAAGQKQAARFTWEATARGTRAIYEDVAARAAGRRSMIRHRGRAS